MKKTKLLNLFGGPGSGKSTTAPLVFAELKKMEKSHGINVALVLEVAKPYATMKVPINNAMQNHIYFQQLHDEMQWLGLVDFLVTDCPTAVGCFYDAFYSGGETALLRFEKQKRDLFEHVDFWLTRNKPYNHVDRYQTEEEAKEVDKEMFRYLDRPALEGSFITLNSDDYASAIIDTLSTNGYFKHDRD